MKIKDTVTEWGSTGTIIKPSDTKIQTGWVGGEQPPHEWENWMRNDRDIALNDVLTRGQRRSSLPTATDQNQMCSGITTPAQAWGVAQRMTLTTAIVGGAYTSDRRASCLGWNPTTRTPELFVAIKYGLYLLIYKYSCWGHESTPTRTLLSTTIIIDNVISCCHDGQYMYLMYNIGGSHNVIKLDTQTWTGAALWTRFVGTATIDDAHDIVVADGIVQGANQLTYL